VRIITPKEKPKKGAHLYKHGMSTNPLHIRWSSMIKRCTYEKHNSYKNYGGAGITVCDRWLNSFENFVSDMGEPKQGQVLDRVDNSKGYSPENCIWTSQSQNLRNTRRAVLITFNGETKNLKDWAIDAGISSAAMKYRIEQWGMERATSTPKRKQI